MRILPQHLETWSERWQEHRTGWDLGGPHPNLKKAMETINKLNPLPTNGSVLSPGCGRAHDAAYLAQQGFYCQAFDAIETPIQEAKNLYKTTQNLELLVCDALEKHPQWEQKFDMIFDRAMYCALPSNQRAHYIQNSRQWIKDSGVLLLLPFSQVQGGSETDGPPFAISLPRLVELLQPHYTLLFAEEFDARQLYGNEESKILQEMITLWKPA